MSVRSATRTPAATPIPATARSRRLAARLAVALGASLLLAPAASAAIPTIGSPSGAVIETSTGTVVYAKNADTPRGMASTTKLMTALVALDKLPLGTELPAVRYAFSAQETRANLKPGERLTVADLLRAMMLLSANDAAQSVAIGVAGTQRRFAALMNQKADALGLRKTHYTNPVGLDVKTHRTTALDLAKLGVAAHDNPFLRATVKNEKLTLKSGDSPRTIENSNQLLGTKLPGGAVIDGMKTGHTNAAGYSFVGSATRDGVTVISAVLGADSEAERNGDSARLLRWASGLFVMRTIVRTTDTVATVPVERGTADELQLVPAAPLRRVVPRGAKVTLQPVTLPASLKAPVAKGTTVAQARVIVNDRVVATIPLVTRAAVEHQGLPVATAESIGEHWRGTLVSLLLLAGGTLTLVRARRSSRPPRRRAPVPGDPT